MLSFVGSAKDFMGKWLHSGPTYHRNKKKFRAPHIFDIFLKIFSGSKHYQSFPMLSLKSIYMITIAKIVYLLILIPIVFNGLRYFYCGSQWLRPETFTPVFIEGILLSSEFCVALRCAFASKRRYAVILIYLIIQIRL